MLFDTGLSNKFCEVNTVSKFAPNEIGWNGSFNDPLSIKKSTINPLPEFGNSEKLRDISDADNVLVGIEYNRTLQL